MCLNKHPLPSLKNLKWKRSLKRKLKKKLNIQSQTLSFKMIRKRMTGHRSQELSLKQMRPNWKKPRATPLPIRGGSRMKIGSRLRM